MLVKQALIVQPCLPMRLTVQQAFTVLVLEQTYTPSAPMEPSAALIPNGLKNAQLAHLALAGLTTSTK